MVRFRILKAYFSSIKANLRVSLSHDLLSCYPVRLCANQGFFNGNKNYFRPNYYQYHLCLAQKMAVNPIITEEVRFKIIYIFVRIVY